MLRDEHALSDDPERRQRQEKAILALEAACLECELAGVVFIRRNLHIFALDEDKLFSAGWNPELPVIQFLSELGIFEVDVHNVIVKLRCGVEVTAER
jgi:hypothetical protein